MTGGNYLPVEETTTAAGNRRNSGVAGPAATTDDGPAGDARCRFHQASQRDPDVADRVDVDDGMGYPPTPPLGLMAAQLEVQGINVQN